MRCGALQATMFVSATGTAILVNEGLVLHVIAALGRKSDLHRFRSDCWACRSRPSRDVRSSLSYKFQERWPDKAREC